MFDSGASTTVMPKVIVDALGIKYEPLRRGFMKLDEKTIQTIGVIKYLPLQLYSFSNITILQDIEIISIPPVFRLCLSRFFTTKIRGYMSLDWSHLILCTKYGSKMVLSEPLMEEHITD